jgi:hypothetical protein
MARSDGLSWTRVDQQSLLKSEARPSMIQPTRWLVQISTDQVLTSGGVPHACHDVGTTAVIGSHSKTLRTTSDLRTLRSRPSMK